ncbi:MAG: hypothetical protein ACFE9I_18840 [Candidatus Hermodarchaeota archaeon]
MAILEVGINLSLKKLVEIKYYSSSDKILDPKIRAQFLTGLENYISEVFDDKINVISFSDFQIICYYKMIQSRSKEESNPSQPLLVFAIVEKYTDPNLVKQHLKKIISSFLECYDLNEIFSKESKRFEDFKPKIDEILGELKLKIEDRIGSVFR